jgi:hypothetical protein
MAACFSPKTWLNTDSFHICSVLFSPIFIMRAASKLVIL